MKTYETQIEIDAAQDRIWQVLTREMPKDSTPYGITKFEGTIGLGAKIKLWSDVVPDRAFSLKVARFDAPNVMVWRGGMPLGLFIGTRTFTITSNGRGAEFHMREVFTGLMAGMITKSMPDLAPSFEKFASTLKQKAEQK